MDIPRNKAEEKASRNAKREKRRKKRKEDEKRFNRLLEVLSVDLGKAKPN